MRPDATTTDGILDLADGGARVRFERRLPHPPEAVWGALTRTRPAGPLAWARGAAAGARWQLPAALGRDRGWHLHLDLLARELDGDPGSWNRERGEELRARYAGEAG